MCELYASSIVAFLRLSASILDSSFVTSCVVYVVIRFNYFIIMLNMFFSIMTLLSSFFSHLFTIFDKLTKVLR